VRCWSCLEPDSPVTGLVKTGSGQDDRPSPVNRRGVPRVAKESCRAEVGGLAMSLAALANSGILSLAAAFWVIAELVWALWPGRGNP
jgi:hypothetical protein